MAKGSPLYFTIGNADGTEVKNGIPRNYYCTWEVSLQTKKGYYITIMRSPSVYEDLNLIISGIDRQELVANRDLISATGQTIEKFALMDAKSIKIFARNVFNAPRNTFLIQLEEMPRPSRSKTFITQMTSIIVVFFCFLTLTSCVTLIIRLKRRAMQQRILAE